MCMITGSFVQEYLVRQDSASTVGGSYAFDINSSSTMPMNVYSTKAVIIEHLTLIFYDQFIIFK